MKKLYLVDVSSMFFRAFFALPPLTNDKGLPTNALYGFLSMAIKLLREIKPDYIAFCFDTKEPSFRLELYPEYKANRAEMPEDLVPQVPYVKKLTSALGIPMLEQPGFEADDIIGTLTKHGLDAGMEVVIVSCDKDFAQLVNPRVSLYDTMKNTRFDVEGVKAKWGVTPKQMRDYLSLVGDASDNVPGVKGVGPKGAQKLLSEFQTLEGVYENLDKISGKALKANLENSRENAFLSQKLVSIHQDVPLELTVESLRLKEIDKNHLRELLLELGFKTFAKTLTGEVAILPTESGGPMPTVAEAPKKSEEVRVRPRSTGAIVGLEWTLQDVEKQIDPYSEIWGMLTERGFYLGRGRDLIKVAVDPVELGRVLSRKNLKWCGFDLKSVWHHLQLIEPEAKWDGMLAAYVLRAGDTSEFSEVYSFYCGQPLPDLLSPEDQFRLLLDLTDNLKSELEKSGMQRVLEEIELPLVPVLYAMEKRGIGLDLNELKRQSADLVQDLTGLEKTIFDLAGGPFNISSPKQLATILFGKLGLPPAKKTKTGYSTDSEVLEKLVPAHPIAKELLIYRELSKLKSTYVEALPHLVNKDTGRIHTRFNQALTTTGRLSSQNPNLQNIPIRTERGRLVRKAFVATQGLELVSADYSQIELRILAHMSEDEALCRAFAEDLDIHAATASEIYSVPIKDVTPELRRAAKAVNFGIAYGQGAFGLAESLGVSRHEGTEIIERYFHRFKRVKEYMDQTIAKAYQDGFVTTLFGRRRYIDELKSKNGALRKFGERAAINAPIQGTASDLVKMAMIKLHQDLSIPMLLQVHDELLFECSGRDFEIEGALIRKGMEGIKKLKVPLKINLAHGPNWEDAHA